MIQTWAIKPHIKGDTFNSRKITFPFDITDCRIDMQFKVTVRAGISFAWSTEDNTFEKISSTEVIMKSRILGEAVSGYISDLQVSFEDGTIYTYLRANLQILQDVTT
jgi:hypothetical protein